MISSLTYRHSPTKAENHVGLFGVRCFVTEIVAESWCFFSRTVQTVVDNSVALDRLVLSIGGGGDRNRAKYKEMTEN